MSNGQRPTAFIAMWPDSFDSQFDDTRLARLRMLAELPEPITAGDLDDPLLAERLASVEVLFTSWGTPKLTAERLQRMPNLRAVFHCAGTVRSVVTDAFWDRDVLITSAAEANAIPVAEFTFASIVLAGKRAQYFARDPRAHRREWRTHLETDRLSNFGRRIGIVGFSRIGQRVVGLLQQLDDVEVLVADPYADPEAVAAAGARVVPLDELLPQVHVLSLHAPELPETARMIGARQLALLPDGATIINTARGALIDTDALAVEAASGRLDAVLDVTEPEPLPIDDVLYDLPNVSITPHIAGSLGSETLRLTDAALDELERFVAGLEPAYAVTVADLGVSA
jgi:phosphoglycerate dehydrogenase-like enzyme